MRGLNKKGERRGDGGTYFACLRLRAIIFSAISVGMGAASLSLSLFCFVDGLGLCIARVKVDVERERRARRFDFSLNPLRTFRSQRLRSSSQISLFVTLSHA